MPFKFSLSKEIVAGEILASFAILISLYSLFSSQHYSEKALENAIKPLLNIDIGDVQSSIPAYGLFIRNSGMGAAKIISAEISFDGRLIPSPDDVKNTIFRCGYPAHPIDFAIISTSIKKEMVIGAGQEVMLFGGNKNQIGNILELDSILGRVSISITYRSANEQAYHITFPYSQR